jgi:hypothetical protein
MYKSIILPIVLSWCETLSLTPKAEHKLKVFANRVLRRKHGPKRVEVAGGWRSLYDEEVQNLDPLPDIIRVINSRRVRQVGLVAHMGEMRNSCKILVGKPEGKRPCRRSRHGLEGNFGIDLLRNKVGGC